MTDAHDALLVEYGPTQDEREQLRSAPFYDDVSSSTDSMSEFFRVHEVRKYCRLLASREANGGNFTYQIVWYDKKKAVPRRNYISANTAHDALKILLDWSSAQKGVSGEDTTCLMECGPAAVNGERLRKMVDDLDGKLAVMGELGLLRDPAVCDASVFYS